MVAFGCKGGSNKPKFGCDPSLRGERMRREEKRKLHKQSQSVKRRLSIHNIYIYMGTKSNLPNKQSV